MIKKLSFTFLLLLLFHFTVLGQTFSKEFGEISQSEIELNSLAENEDAEAVVLFDIGKSYFKINGNSFDLIHERTTRIKVLTEAGIKWGEVEVPIYKEGSKSEEVYDIEGYSYNIENADIKKVPFNTSNIYTEKINQNWDVIKFAIPNVKEGTVIEYKYKIKSKYKFNFRDWEFQWRIPVEYSEYEIGMIPFYDYSWLLQGADQLDLYTSNIGDETHYFGPVDYREMMYKFIMKDVPAFDSEEFITSINDYIIKIDFQLSKINQLDGTTHEIMTTWEDMNKEFLDHINFGRYIKNSERFASKLLDLKNLKLKDEIEVFDHVIEYVKENYSWNKRYGKYATKSVGKLVKDKFGNSGDINLFAIGLLNAAGIDAKPVLISTRGNGKIKFDYPYTSFFNYVVILAKVDGVYELTDATNILNLNNRLPIRGLNDKGLVIQKDKVDWINMETRIPSEIKTDIQIEGNAKDTIKSTISKTATEYDALYYRTIYADKRKTIKEKLDSKDYTVMESSISVENQLNIKEPYILTYEQVSKPEVVNEKIYLSPFLDEVISDNPLKQKTRTYPIDMTYPKKRIFNATILIPEDFEVDYLPSERTINNQLFELTYAIESEDDTINISFDYHFKNPIYSPNDYAVIKAFFDIIVKKGNEKIVLSKKEEG